MARSRVLTSAIESRSSCVRLTLTEASLIFNFYERASDRAIHQHSDGGNRTGYSTKPMIQTPRGGLVDDGNGNQALAYGVIINIFEPHPDGDQYSAT
jgi:hypothetical protein